MVPAMGARSTHTITVLILNSWVLVVVTEKELFRRQPAHEFCCRKDNMQSPCQMHRDIGARQGVSRKSLSIYRLRRVSRYGLKRRSCVLQVKMAARRCHP